MPEKPSQRPLAALIRGVSIRALQAPIVFYRRAISPLLGPRCRFYPTCSQYALTALARHGPIKGLGLAVWRILRCHPLNAGGHDPVPPEQGRDAQ